jgi:hypothetical protein
MRLSYDETVAALEGWTDRFVVAWFQTLSEDREMLVALGTASGRLTRAVDAPTPPGEVMFTVGSGGRGGSITVSERTFAGAGRGAAPVVPAGFPDDAFPLRDGESLIVLYHGGGCVRVTVPLGPLAEQLE